MCIGSGCLKDKVENAFEISETSIMKILGIFFGRNKKECEVLNWNDKVKKIKQILIL